MIDLAVVGGGAAGISAAGGVRQGRSLSPARLCPDNDYATVHGAWQSGRDAVVQLFEAVA